MLQTGFIVILLVLSSLLGKAWAATGEANIPLVKDAREMSVSDFPRFAIDPEGKLTIEEILAGTWPHHQKRNPSFGWTKDVVWLMSSLEKQDNRLYAVEIGYPLLDDVQIYVVRDGKILSHLQTGDHVEDSPEIIDPIDPAFYLPREVGRYEIYLRIASSSSVQAPLKLYADQVYSVKEKEEFFATGIYVGIIAIMALYNLFIYFASRNRSYLYYTSFVATFLFLQLSLSGHTAQYLWPAFPWLSDAMICQGGTIATLFMVLFAKEYLGIEASGPRRKKAIRILMGALGLVVISSLFIAYVIAVRTMAVSSMLAVLVVLGIAIYHAIQGQREARFYLLAWGVFITGCVIYLLKQLGILPVTLLTSYAFKIGSVFEVALLSLALADRLNVMRAQLKKANVELKDLNENLEIKVEEKTRDIKSMLANLPQGIFQVRLEADKIMIEDEHSAFLSEMIPDTVFARHHPVEAIFAKSDLSSDSLSIIDSVLQSTLNEDAFTFEMNGHSLPREMTIKNRLIEIDWSPVLDEDQVIRKMLITLRDVTELRQAQLQAMQKIKEIQTLGEIARHDAVKMQDLLKVCDDLFRTCIDKFTSNLDFIALAFRNLHTIKGLARNFDFKALTNATHEAEQCLKQMQSAQITDAVLADARAKIQTAYQVFLEYRRINNEVLGRDQLLDKVLIDRSDLVNIHQKLQSAITVDAVREVESQILFLFEAKLQQVIKDELSLLDPLCQSLGKPVPAVHFIHDDYMIPANAKTALRKAFVHLLRNSLAHGIESAEERVENGKDEHGHIHIEVAEIDQHMLKITYRDDGRGLALKRIHKLAVERGIFSAVTIAYPNEIAQLIFRPGFSTQTTVNDMAGRGVGMDAVRSFVEEVGGRIELVLKDSEYKEFVPIEFAIYLPFNEEELRLVS